MQQTLYRIFGNQLIKPTSPPPVDSAGDTPTWTIPTPVKTSSVLIPTKGSPFLVNLAASTGTAPTTTTTVPPEGDQYFDPYPCTPK